jgi:serine/threonine protein kinase
MRAEAQMVMEYCDGGSLQSLIEGVDLNEGQIANVLRKALASYPLPSQMRDCCLLTNQSRC